MSLYSNREDIGNIALYHLGLSPLETCQIREGQHSEKRALIRFPLPYKVGESKNPGNVDEKLRYKATTFI
ncbi:hypothetical protein N7513_008851 [Penicillium frequentans]|nr:hypothetical protein N7513_008851 [Penicillium glabrum]